MTISRVTHAYEVICVILQNKCKLCFDRQFFLRCLLLRRRFPSLIEVLCCGKKGAYCAMVVSKPFLTPARSESVCPPKTFVYEQNFRCFMFEVKIYDSTSI